MTQLQNSILPKVSAFTNKPDNNINLSDISFEKFRKLIYENCGIYFQNNKKYLLESRLLRRINFLSIDSFEEYYKYLLNNLVNRHEINYLFEAITINETFFFRNQPQLEALVTKVIPEILVSKRANAEQKIRIWSAASSSGEEAYSTAIVIVDLLKPKYPNLKVEIIGTDINSAVIETAKHGIYKEYSIRNTPAYYLRKYFRNSGSSYEIIPEIKRMVTFKQLNLVDDIRMRSMSNFDIIFCANVLIYFDNKAKIKVVNHLYNSLNKSGYLFIGYAETLHTISNAFSIENFPKTIGYKKE